MHLSTPLMENLSSKKRLAELGGSIWRRYKTTMFQALSAARTNEGASVQTIKNKTDQELVLGRDKKEKKTRLEV